MVFDRNFTALLERAAPVAILSLRPHEAQSIGKLYSRSALHLGDAMLPWVLLDVAHMQTSNVMPPSGTSF